MIAILFSVIINDIRIEVRANSINRKSRVRRKIIDGRMIIVEEKAYVIISTKITFISRRLITIVIYTSMIIIISIKMYLIFQKS